MIVNESDEHAHVTFVYHQCALLKNALVFFAELTASNGKFKTNS